MSIWCSLGWTRLQYDEVFREADLLVMDGVAKAGLEENGMIKNWV